MLHIWSLGSCTVKDVVERLLEPTGSWLRKCFNPLLRPNGANGEIRYQGVSINKFYVEGMDAFGGRYGLVTDNIRAADIAKVEVIENHSPLKVLKDLDLSTQAAINLKLKNSSKGIWSGHAKWGVGYEPVSWNAETLYMYFSRNFQNLNFYKTNNTGDDYDRELVSHYNRRKNSEFVASNIQKPLTPLIAPVYYRDNKAHFISTNFGTRLRDNLTLTGNAFYLEDTETMSGESVTTYYRPDTASWTISEVVKAVPQARKGGGTFQIEWNTDRLYISNETHYTGTSYKTKRLECAAELRNLLNRKNIYTVAYGDATNYMYSYRLRPLNIMLSVNFSF